MRPWLLMGMCAIVIATAPAAAAEPTGDNSDFAPYGDGVPTVISGGPVPTNGSQAEKATGRSRHVARKQTAVGAKAWLR